MFLKGCDGLCQMKGQDVERGRIAESKTIKRGNGSEVGRKLQKGGETERS